MGTSEQYLNLIGQVAELDVYAALYMRGDARLLATFEETNILAFAFVWPDTPQGYDYWLNLARLLGRSL